MTVKNMTEKTFETWYKVYEVELSVRDLLGSLPATPEQLKYVKKIYESMTGPGKEGKEKAEQLMDVEEEAMAEAEAMEEKVAGRCVFRRDEEGNLYLSQGQIVGWLEETIKAANLSRSIRNVALTFWTEPNRILLGRKLADGETIRPVRGFIGGKFQTTLALHEKINHADLKFKILTTNPQFTEKVAEQIFDIAKRINLGPARQHGFGEITELTWKKLQ